MTKRLLTFLLIALGLAAPLRAQLGKWTVVYVGKSDTHYFLRDVAVDRSLPGEPLGGTGFALPIAAGAPYAFALTSLKIDCQARTSRVQVTFYDDAEGRTVNQAALGTVQPPGNPFGADIARVACNGLDYPNGQEEPAHSVMSFAELRKIAIAEAAMWGDLAKGDAEVKARDYAAAAKRFENACSGKVQAGCSRLAGLYYRGQGVAADRLKAIDLLKSGCDGGYAFDCTIAGRRMAEFVKIDLPAGTSPAIVNFFLARSKQVAPLYERGCDGGDAKGCFNAGLLAYKGEGVAQDKARAFALYTRACDGGYALGCNNAGVLAYKGEGVARDKARAFALYTRACDGGGAEGCFNAGVLANNGEGVARDKARAFALYTRACDGGYALGCNNAGVLADKGEGVARDKARAFALYTRACDGGGAEGCFNAGVLAYDGEGVARDEARAFALYTRACDGGDAEGCFNAGLLADKGEGVAQDKAKAFALYTRACDGGDAKGCNNAGLLADNGEGVARDKARAFALYTRACDGGDAQGCTNAGASMIKGEGVAANREGGITYLRRALAIDPKHQMAIDNMRAVGAR